MLKITCDDEQLKEMTEKYGKYVLIVVIFVVAQVVLADLAIHTNICNYEYDVYQWVRYFLSATTSGNLILSLICLLMVVNRYEDDDLSFQIIVGLCNIFNLVSSTLALSNVGGSCVDALGVSTLGSIWPTFIFTQLFFLYSAYGLSDKIKSSNHKYVHKCNVNLGLYFACLLISFPWYTDAPYGLALAIPVICTCYFIYIVLDLYMSERNHNHNFLFLFERFYNHHSSNADDSEVTKGTIDNILMETKVTLRTSLVWFIILGVLRYPIFYLFSATNLFNGSMSIFFQILFNFCDSLYLTYALIDGHLVTRDKALTRLQEEVIATIKRRSHLRMVFHDVRGPLSNVVMGLEILFSNEQFLLMFAEIDNPDDDTVETLEDMKVAAEDCMTTLNHCLDMEKIESEETAKLLLNEFEPRQLVEKVMKQYKITAKKKCIEIITQIDEAVPVALMGDQFKIQHVLMNLLSNSIKYSPNNTCVTIRVESKPRNSEGEGSPVTNKSSSDRFRLNQHHNCSSSNMTDNTPVQTMTPLCSVNASTSAEATIHSSILGKLQRAAYHLGSRSVSRSNHSDELQQQSDTNKQGAEWADVTFSIIDQGQGMSVEEQTKLFQPFMQGKHKVKQTVESTGLGLAQCERNVKLHHGKIGCTSTSIDVDPTNHGTTFWFNLPLEVSGTSRRCSMFKRSSKFLIPSSLIMPHFGTDNLPNLTDSQLKMPAATVTATGFSQIPVGETATILTHSSSAASLPSLPLPSVTSTADISRSANAPDKRASTPSPGSTGRGSVSDSSNTQTSQMARFSTELNILIVDDESTAKKILSKQLKKKNANCETADHGKHALDIYRQHDPNYFDIIFTDGNMPEMGGLELASSLRAEGFKNMIVGLTGEAFEDELNKFLERGADLVVSKPLDLKKQAALIAHVEALGIQHSPNLKYCFVGDEIQQKLLTSHRSPAASCRSMSSARSSTPSPASSPLRSTRRRSPDSLYHEHSPTYSPTSGIALTSFPINHSARSSPMKNNENQPFSLSPVDSQKSQSSSSKSWFRMVMSGGKVKTSSRDITLSIDVPKHKLFDLEEGPDQQSQPPTNESNSSWSLPNSGRDGYSNDGCTAPPQYSVSSRSPMRKCPEKRGGGAGQHHTSSSKITLESPWETPTAANHCKRTSFPALAIHDIHDSNGHINGDSKHHYSKCAEKIAVEHLEGARDSRGSSLCQPLTLLPLSVVVPPSILPAVGDLEPAHVFRCLSYDDDKDHVLGQSFAASGRNPALQR